MPEDAFDRMGAARPHRFTKSVVEPRIGAVLEQPVHLRELAARGVVTHDRAAHSGKDVHVGTALDEHLHIAPLVLFDQRVKQQRLVVGIARVRVSTVIQQNLQIDRIFLPGGPDHRVRMVRVRSSRFARIRLGNVRIGPVLQHRAQAVGIAAVDRPREHRSAAIAAPEDHVRVDAFVLHQPAHGVGIARCRRNRERLRAGLFERPGCGGAFAGRVGRRHRQHTGGQHERRNEHRHQAPGTRRIDPTAPPARGLSAVVRIHPCHPDPSRILTPSDRQPSACPLGKGSRHRNAPQSDGMAHHAPVPARPPSHPESPS